MYDSIYLKGEARPKATCSFESLCDLFHSRKKWNKRYGAHIKIKKSATTTTTSSSSLSAITMTTKNKSVKQQATHNHCHCNHIYNVYAWENENKNQRNLKQKTHTKWEKKEALYMVNMMLAKKKRVSKCKACNISTKSYYYRQGVPISACFFFTKEAAFSSCHFPFYLR